MTTAPTPRLAVPALAQLHARIRELPGVDVVEERPRPRPDRVCIDVRRTGVSGHELGRLVRALDDLDLELHDHHVVARVGPRDAVPERGTRLLFALHRAFAQLR
jgi:hypothetical protein